MLVGRPEWPDKDMRADVRKHQTNEVSLLTVMLGHVHREGDNETHAAWPMC